MTLPVISLPLTTTPEAGRAPRGGVGAAGKWPAAATAMSLAAAGPLSIAVVILHHTWDTIANCTAASTTSSTRRRFGNPYTPDDIAQSAIALIGGTLSSGGDCPVGESNSIGVKRSSLPASWIFAGRLRARIRPPPARPTLWFNPEFSTAKPLDVRF